MVDKEQRRSQIRAALTEGTCIDALSLCLLCKQKGIRAIPVTDTKRYKEAAAKKGDATRNESKSSG